MAQPLFLIWGNRTPLQIWRFTIKTADESIAWKLLDRANCACLRSLAIRASTSCCRHFLQEKYDYPIQEARYPPSRVSMASTTISCSSGAGCIALGRLGLPASTSPSSQCSELLPVHVMALSGCWAGQIRWRDEDIELALSRSPFSSCGHQLCRAVVFSLSVELAISRNCSLSVG